MKGIRPGVGVVTQQQSYKARCWFVDGDVFFYVLGLNKSYM